MEAVIALAILAFICTMLTPSVALMKKASLSNGTYYQDEIGIYQLQLELAVNDIVSVGTDSITYDKEGDRFTLHIVNNKLISQPGTLDFIHGIDRVRFYQQEDIIYIEYNRKERKFCWPLAYRLP